MEKKAFTAPTLLSRAVTYLRNDAVKAWEKVICDLKEARFDSMSLMLQAATFFKLYELTERQSRNGNHFKITSYPLKVDKLVKVLDKDSQGRTRFVRVWVDSAVGFPDPRIRLGTTNGSVTASGVRLIPGNVNEIGNIPDTTELYMMSDVDITVFIVEEA